MTQAQKLPSHELEKFIEDLDSVCVNHPYPLSAEQYHRASMFSTPLVTLSIAVSLNFGGSVVPARSCRYHIYSPALSQG